MAQVSVNAQRFDPYKNFKFRVKWDGRYVAGISKVGALKRSTQLVEHREGGDPSTSRKSPGRTKFEAVSLERVRLVRQFWIWNLSSAWMGILPPIMAVQAARQLRYCGVRSDTWADEVCALLTIGGLFLVLKGYADLRDHFGKKPLMALLLAYLADFAGLWRSGIISGTGHGSMGVMGMGNLTVGAAPNASLEQRVAALEQKMAGVLRTLATELSQVQDDLGSQIAAERAERQRQVQASKKLLEETTIGGLGSAVTGWIWFLASALFTGFPQLWVFLVT